MFKIPFSYTTFGIILSIAGNLLISVSLNIQKSAHLDLASSSTRINSNQQYYKNFKWQLGFILMSFGEIGNFVSYGLAPVSLVAPLGVVTIISNSTFVAPVLFHEKIGVMNIVGTFLCAFGVVLMISCSMNTNQDAEPIKDPFSYVDSLVANESTLIYVIVTTTLVLFLIVSLSLLQEKHKKRTIKYILSNLTIVAIVGSYTATSTKLLSSIVEFAPFDKIITNYRSYGLLFVIIFTSVLQIKHLNECLAVANATTVVPIHFVFFTSSVLICSTIVFRDFSEKTPLQMIVFLLGAFFTFSGVFFICGTKSDQSNNSPLTVTANTPNRQRLTTSNSIIPSTQLSKTTSHISNDAKSTRPLSRAASSMLSADKLPQPLLASHFPTANTSTQMGILLQSSKSSPELVRNPLSADVSPCPSPPVKNKTKGHSHWLDPCSQLTPLISSGVSDESNKSTLTYNAISSPLQKDYNNNPDYQSPEVGSSYYNPRSSSFTPRKLTYNNPDNNEYENETGNYSAIESTSEPKRKFSLGEFPHSSFDLESLRSGLFRNEGEKRSVRDHGYFVLNNGGLINSIIGTNDGLDDVDNVNANANTNTDTSLQSSQGKEQQKIFPLEYDSQCQINEDGYEEASVGDTPEAMV